MMKKYLLLGMLPTIMFGENLQSLLESAVQNNHLIYAKKINKNAKAKEIEGIQKSYYPTIDVNGFYKRDDDATPFQPGTTYGASLKVGFDIYDGGRKLALKQQKESEYKASSFDTKAQTKNILLAIVRDFYQLKTLQATLQAQIESSKAVKAQLQRIQHFYEAKLVTHDDVDRLQSAYDSNLYAIESIKFQITSLQKSLELKVGKKIQSFDDSFFVKKEDKPTKLDAIRSLEYKKMALKHLAKSVVSAYKPMVHIEDKYTLYGYKDKPQIRGLNFLDHQNEILLSAGMRVFDFGALKTQKEVIKLQANALQQQILYKTKEQQMQQELALQRIQSAKLNIKSSKSALKAAMSALQTITQKYNAGVVDNVTYLDALSAKTKAKALYEASLNNLEMAYAMYYFYNNKNLMEYLQ
ncbi:Probable outer membrane component of multidrug efflux pump [hydrothermal vent metagenome]|uniref:Probable outer membrane component of multidrug efflux pump n=1 Tax=hydrothermal vent metagenome TaxID=652676 RepID=A0A1W1D4L3_9ZZZZ